MMEEESPGEPLATAAFRAIGLADLVLADLTGSNPNVLFELGAAYRGAKRVIRIAQKNTAGSVDLPFMVQGDNVIFYESLMDLKEQLTRAIPRAKPWGID